MNKEKISVKSGHKRSFSFLLSLFSLLIFTACQNPASPSANLSTLPEEKGSFSLTLSNRARTILPATPGTGDFAVYNLAFTPASGSVVSVDRTNATLPTNPVLLDPGTYSLVVSAYRDSGKTTLLARGTASGIVITAGANTSRAVTLEALLSGGQGTFRWNITLPAGVTTASMTIAGGETVNLTTTASASRSLSSGRYNLTFDLKKADATVVWKELLYVYQNLESSFTFGFTDAYFSNPNYTVTYKYDNGSSDGVLSILHGATLTRPADPSKTYYTFGGWYTDAGLTQAFNFGNAVTANLTLHAKWNPILYTVTFNANGGQGAVPAQMSVQAGPASAITLPTAGGLSHPTPGYVFAGWNTAANGSGITYSAGANYGVAANTTLYAKWEPTPVAFSGLSANGTAGSVTTTQLTLTFDKAITGLTAADITLTAGSTGATKGALSGSGPTYTLEVNGITAAGTVTVGVSKSGYTFAPASQTVTVNVAPGAVSFTSLAANGNEVNTPTTVLTLTFNKVITGLTADDITLTAGSTGATKGALSGSGPTYTLAVSGITADGEVTVSVSKAGYSISPNRTVQVHKGYVAVTLSQDGIYGAKTTTRITITFDKDVPDFSLNTISYSNTVSMTLGSFLLVRKSDREYDLFIYLNYVDGSGFITITPTKAGYNFRPISPSISVYHYSPDIAVSFTGLTADGSAAATTSKLTLQFDKDINGLGPSDIALNAGSTGATIGALSKTGTGRYELALSGITAAGQVTVSVSKDGYTFAPASRNVAINHYAPPPVSIAGLNITFDQIADSAPSITSGLTLYRNSGNGRDTSATFSVANPAQYSSIAWYVNGRKLGGYSYITIHAMNYEYYSVGEHFLTLEVVRNGRTYSKRVTFNIAN